MQIVVKSDPLKDKVSSVLLRFTEWLDAFGETSLDIKLFLRVRLVALPKPSIIGDRRWALWRSRQ